MSVNEMERLYEGKTMNTQEYTIWHERADYVDTLLHLKHKTFERKAHINPQVIVEQVGIKAALINSLRKRFSNPKVYHNPFVRLLFNIKNKLGIKFR